MDVPTNGEILKAEEKKEPVAQKDNALPPPSFGFDETGTFHLQIHSKAGFLAMIGFTQKAVFWLNDRMNEFEAKKKNESLIKPASKGFGRFNLFK